MSARGTRSKKTGKTEGSTKEGHAVKFERLHFLFSLCLAGGAALCMSNAANASVDPMTQDIQVRAELDALGPDPLVTAANTALGFATAQNGNVMRRIAALRSGARGLDLGGLDVQFGERHIAGNALNAVSKPTLGGILDGVLSERSAADRIGLFANGSVVTGNAYGSHNAANDRADVTTGIDYRLSDRFVLGASVGYTNLNGQSDPARGALDVESWRGTLFGSYYTEQFHLDGLLAYGDADYLSQRCIADPQQSMQAIATGSTRGRQLSGQLAGAFDFKYGAWTFGPHIGASFLDAEVDPLDESGAGDYDLRVGKQSAQSIRFNAGAHLALPSVALPLMPVPWNLVVTPHVNADFVRDVQSRAGAVEVRLADDQLSNVPVVLRPDRPAAGYLVWSVGAAAKLARDLSGFVDYRSFAGVGDLAWNELTWGVRFEATL